MTTMNSARHGTPSPNGDYEAFKGREVVTADGQKIGTIEAVLHPLIETTPARSGHFFLVMPGFLQSLFGTDAVYIPETAIAAVDDDRVTLAVATDQLATQGWTSHPEHSETRG